MTATGECDTRSGKRRGGHDDIGLLFWVLMVFWIVSWIGTRWGPYTSYVYASEFLFFVLLFLLGWHSFGFIIHA